MIVQIWMFTSAENVCSSRDDILFNIEDDAGFRSDTCLDVKCRVSPQ